MRACEHCGAGLVRRGGEKPSVFAVRRFCGTQCAREARRKYDDRLVEQIRQLSSAHRTRREIAEALGISPERVTELQRYYQIESLVDGRESPAPRVWTAASLNEVWRLIETGMTVRQIAVIVGTTERAIYGAINYHQELRRTDLDRHERLRRIVARRNENRNAIRESSSAEKAAARLVRNDLKQQQNAAIREKKVIQLAQRRAERHAQQLQQQRVNEQKASFVPVAWSAGNDPLLQQIDAAVSRSVPAAIREDVCQELAIAILSGAITSLTPDIVRGAVTAAYRESPWSGKRISLDAPFEGDGESTLLDMLLRDGWVAA